MCRRFDAGREVPDDVVADLLAQADPNADAGDLTTRYPKAQIREAIGYGVIKMNIDTDTQYAFTRPIADHMLRNYDGVLKVDGEVGNKKAYDPRAWGKSAEAGLSARVVEACENLRSAGTKIT